MSDNGPREVITFSKKALVVLILTSSLGAVDIVIRYSQWMNLDRNNIYDYGVFFESQIWIMMFIIIQLMVIRFSDTIINLDYSSIKNVENVDTKDLVPKLLSLLIVIQLLYTIYNLTSNVLYTII